MARPSSKLTAASPSFTVQAVLPADLAPRIQALRIEGPNIFSVSTVIREAIRRGLVQLELERSLGRSIGSEPLQVVLAGDGAGDGVVTPPGDRLK